MGYPMARNLRAKIPAEDTLVIYDVNPSTTESFLHHLGVSSKGVIVAHNVSEVADKSVSV